MKSKIQYTDGPIGKLRRVKDFLPPPELLVRREETSRITINLNKTSVDYFKQLAGKSHQKYQRVIRNLLDYYVIHHQLDPINKAKVK